MTSVGRLDMLPNPQMQLTGQSLPGAVIHTTIAVPGATGASTGLPVISQAVTQLLASRDEQRHWARAIAIMRRGFGGHPLGRDDAVQRERREGRVGEIFREES